MTTLSPRFPLPDTVPVNGLAYPPEQVLRVLEPYLSSERHARIEAVVAARTFSVVPVLEGLVDAGNVNAVLRSAEGLGYGAAHLVALEVAPRGLPRPSSTLSSTPMKPSPGVGVWPLGPARAQTSGSSWRRIPTRRVTQKRFASSAMQWL